MIRFQFCDTSVGCFLVAEEGGRIIEISRRSDYPEELRGDSDLRQEDSSVLQEASRQLKEYIRGIRTEFDLPLSLKGTPFQKEVWEALRRIPYGETRSYGDIAREISNPQACRAVGMANHHNPILFVIPCHRVIASDGKMGGYAAGIDLKAYLLSMESKAINAKGIEE